ncbi:MAG: hypothetical protein H6Q15_33 [Bacteroidetes bacterium]|nr:hypothetical protein [Bacteroidota bacterium]
MVKRIIINCLIILLLTSCLGQSKEKEFIVKNEFEDFSQFKGVNVFKRGGDKNQEILAMLVSYIVNDNKKEACYFVTMDKIKHQVIKAKWTTEYSVEADTLKLEQLAQTFMKYTIPRLDVDNVGNVFVYLKDVETISLARFIDESELQKRSKETKWIKIKDNWYKPR